MPIKAEKKLRKSLCELIPWYKEEESGSNKNSNKKSKNNNNNSHHHNSNSNIKLKDVANSALLNKNLDFSLDILPVSHWLTQSGATISMTNNESEKKQNESSNSEKIIREIQRSFLRFFTAIFGSYRTFFYKNKKQNIWEWDKNKFLDEGGWNDKQSRVMYFFFVCVLTDFWVIYYHFLSHVSCFILSITLNWHKIDIFSVLI